MSHNQYDLLRQEQQRREEAERQLYYIAASMEEMHRQLLDLQNAYQQQCAMLEHERQQRAALVEQVKQQQQQQAMLVEKGRRRASSKQRQLMERVSAEVRRFQVAPNNCGDASSGDADALTADIESLFSREMLIVPSEIPAPNKYPHVDWSLDYSMARLEDMMEAPESTRNTLFYALLSFHVKRLEMLDVDSAACDDLIKRVNNELCQNQQ